jgi:adenylate cyclase
VKGEGGAQKWRSEAEEGTFAQIRSFRRTLVDRRINENHGRIVKTMGDGILVEFASGLDAVRCAVDIQRQMMEWNADLPSDKRVEFRIGINMGDVIIADNGDIFGDVVNVAARLEGIAEPGGICVSGRVKEDVEGKLDVLFGDNGEQRLKNIATGVRVYQARIKGATPTQAPVVADKPSIAVLPFENLSEDPRQEYFADGMVEDITTALSRIRWLFVIARNSSFAYKGKAIDVKQVGRDLGVRYVLEGSIRKSKNQVRITVGFRLARSISALQLRRNLTNDTFGYLVLETKDIFQISLGALHCWFRLSADENFAMPRRK